MAVYEIGNVTRAEDFGDHIHVYEARYMVDNVVLSSVRFTHARNDGIGACVETALRALREKG